MNDRNIYIFSKIPNTGIYSYGGYGLLISKTSRQVHEFLQNHGLQQPRDWVLPAADLSHVQAPGLLDLPGQNLKLMGHLPHSLSFFR
jgi:hypothetical protein